MQVKVCELYHDQALFKGSRTAVFTALACRSVLIGPLQKRDKTVTAWIPINKKTPLNMGP